MIIMIYYTNWQHNLKTYMHKITAEYVTDVPLPLSLLCCLFFVLLVYRWLRKEFYKMERSST